MIKMQTLTLYLFVVIFGATSCIGQGVQDDIYNKVQDHYAFNEDVRIHYVTMGRGPLILFVHGFPDFWYTWRDQMHALAKDYTVAAVDLRGYNLSDHPFGVDKYQYDYLVKDLVAVLQKNGSNPAYIVAHDWGAAISWRLAINYPDLVKKLVILSIAHPKAGDRADAIILDPEAPTYADEFLTEAFREKLTATWFSGWVKDSAVKARYREAFKHSDKDAMINYYRANFPTRENLQRDEFRKNREKDVPLLKMPVLIIHGKKDPYAPTAGHNNVWEYVDNEITIEILPDAGHFIQQDESEKVTSLIKYFLSK